MDLTRVTGDWFVIATMPALPEVDAHDAAEFYRLAPDGVIATTFTFRAGAPTRPRLPSLRF